MPLLLALVVEKDPGTVHDDVVAQLAPGFNVPIPGIPAGSIGSVVGLTNTIADAIKVAPTTAASAAVTSPAEIAADEVPSDPVAVQATSEISDSVEATAIADPTDEPVAVAFEAAPEQIRATGIDDSSPKRGGHTKAGRGDNNDAAASASQEAPKRSAKAGASRG